MLALLLKLFWTFFVIGLFNFGGGGAVLSLIQGKVVYDNAWMTETDFTDIVAVSQSTPGPIGINCATYLGYEVITQAGYGTFWGVIGSAITTLAVVLPSFIVFVLIIKLFNKFHENKTYIFTMDALKPAIAGLIISAALMLVSQIELSWGNFSFELSENIFSHWSSWVFFAVAFILGYFKNVSPATLILAAAVLGIIVY